MKKRLTSAQVSNIADNILHSSKLVWYLFILIILGAIITFFVLSVKQNAPVPEVQVNALEQKESILRESFASLPTLDNVEVVAKDGIATVTFYGEDCKLVVVYDEYLDVISSEFKNYIPKEEFFANAVIGCILIPGVIYILLGCIVFSCFDIVIKIKQKQEKVIKKGDTYEN